MPTKNETPEYGVQGMLSVIIPVLNEASYIEHVIRSVQKVALRKEIIVVDGSRDGLSFPRFFYFSRSPGVRAPISAVSSAGSLR